MIESPTSLADRAAALRHSFDQSFATPRRFDAPAREDLLAIRLGTEAWAVGLSEVAGLFVDTRITAVPGTVDTLLGIAAFRGTIMPVYDLGGFLGHARSGALRWLVIAASAPVAFAFQDFDGHRRLPGDAILPRDEGDPDRRFVRAFARAPDGVRPVLHLAAIVDAITQEFGRAGPGEER